MKGIKILRNGKNLGVIFGLIFTILILNIALADVSVSSIITDKQNYNPGDVVKIEFNASIVDQSGACVLDGVNFSITDGISLSCSLPNGFGTYTDYNCNGHNINLTVTQKYYNCNQYGGNNTYYYVIYWQIPNNWNRETYTIGVNISSGGKTGTSNTTLNIAVTPPPPLPGGGGGACTTCGPQQYHEIPVGKITTTQQISTNISDTTTPGKHCFKTECTTNTYQDGKTTISSSTKNVPTAANITLTLPDGKSANVHTNANGEICYNFGCGIYTITIPKGVCGEEYSKTITSTYGKLYITPSDLTKAMTNDVLTYIIKDDGGNAVKGAKVSIVLPDGNMVKTSDFEGKITFNVGEKEGSYKIIAQKDCYENDTLTGTIGMPKLTITCDSQVNINEILCCYVKDQDGNNVEGANVKLTMPGGKEIQLISDANGKVCTNETQIEGDVTAVASKKGYKDSGIATSKITALEIICLKECKCGCEEGTATCKTCPECNIFGLPCWILLLLLLLIALLLFFLLRKKKIYADEESINKAIREGQLENIANKYSKIYVSKKVYDNIQGMDIKDKVKNKFEFADLDEKGKNYLKECGDEHVARAKQLNVDLLTSNDETAKKAEENKINVKRYEEI